MGEETIRDTIFVILAHGNSEIKQKETNSTNGFTVATLA